MLPCSARSLAFHIYVTILPVFSAGVNITKWMCFHLPTRIDGFRFSLAWCDVSYPCPNFPYIFSLHVVFVIEGLFALNERLHDLNMSEIQNTLPEGTFSRSQKHSCAEMGAVVYGMSDEIRSLLIERACSKRTRVVHDVPQFSHLPPFTMP